MLYIVTTADTALGRLLRGRRALTLADLPIRNFDRDYLSGLALGEASRIAIVREERDHPLVKQFCRIARAHRLPPLEELADPHINGDCHVLVLHRKGSGPLGAYYLAPDPPNREPTNGGVAPSATNGSNAGAVW